MAEKSFEQLYAALEEKARKLEQGNLPLEASLKLYEEGAAIADDLRKILEGAELKVKTLHVRLEDDRAQIREVEADYDGEPDGESSEYEE
ncbi:MAG: exodeoxyribonuclease VII small subunit [Tepidiformaceae bacterium]